MTIAKCGIRERCAILAVMSSADTHAAFAAQTSRNTYRANGALCIRTYSLRQASAKAVASGSAVQVQDGETECLHM